MMHRFCLGFVLILLIACKPQQYTASQLSENAHEVVDLFLQSCANQDGEENRVQKWANDRHLQVLDQKAQKQLPFGMIEIDAKHVWRLEKKGAVFYLSTNQDGCSVKTPVANEKIVRQRFSEMARQINNNINLRADHYTSTPFPFSQLVYAWQHDEQAMESLLTANTSPSQHIPVQAALSFVKKTLGVQTNILEP